MTEPPKQPVWYVVDQPVDDATYRALPRGLRRVVRRSTAMREATQSALREVVNREYRAGGLPPLEVALDEHDIPEVIGTGPNVAYCVVFQTRWPWCDRYAGSGTLHPGTGPCRLHGGNSVRERRAGAVVTAHAIARTMQVNPWEALEIGMQRAFTWSAWYQSKLATVTDDDELRPGGAAWDWVRGAERTTELAVKYAKMALDAGVAERQVQQAELQGQLIARVLSTTLRELGMSEDDELRARAVLEVVLRQVAESGDAKVITGELT